VQNPEEAAFPSMPLSALREIEVDYTLPLAEIGPLLYRLATESVISKSRAVYAGETGTNVAPAQKAYAGEPEMEAVLTDLTCPDCRGTIWEVKRGNAKDYQCRVGHTFSARTMLAEHFATQEKVLYSAIVALEEGASLATRVADQFPPEFRERLLQESSQRKQEAKRLRQLIEERVTFEFD
jgi:two-component system chemotaxis response regulator CheB